MTMEGRRDFQMERRIILAITGALESEDIKAASLDGGELPENSIEAAIIRAAVIVSQAVILNR